MDSLSLSQEQGRKKHTKEVEWWLRKIKILKGSLLEQENERAVIGFQRYGQSIFDPLGSSLTRLTGPKSDPDWERIALFCRLRMRSGGAQATSLLCIRIAASMAASALKLWRSREMVTVARVRPSFLYVTAQSRASRLPSISIASHFSAWPT